ncbi:universal stress protein [Haloferax sp. KTX1]|uniref:universal stress protein n=1 Tax=Haloferax sp. KTX1 TaxID=2600597 RepID=UPI0011DC7343|nr:universal stress protein [Haloferax sp. KTX1]
MISRVLVPMDDSEMAERALKYALEAHSDAEITVLHVVGEPSPMMGKAVSLALENDIEQAAEEHASEVLQRARDIAGEYDTEILTDVTWGHPAKAIIKRAENFDTVVIGSHGGTLAERLFVGNVAERIFRRSPVPVTIVR